VNREQLGGAFSARELCELVTANPADALGWSDRLGRLRPGLLADLLVTARRHDDPYRNLIEATERQVRLVLVGGRPVYGTPSLLEAAGALSPEPIRVAGLRRAISLVDPAIPDADLGWQETLASLEAARQNPERAHRRAVARAGGAEPFRLIPDQPGDELDPSETFRTVRGTTIPPLDSISPDLAFFLALEQAPIMNGLLNGLCEYYRPAGLSGPA
jgi:hypothetical protein